MKKYLEYIKELNLWNCPTAYELPDVPVRDEYLNNIHMIYNMISDYNNKIADDGDLSIIKDCIIQHLKKYINEYNLKIVKAFDAVKAYDIYLNSKYHDGEKEQRFLFEIRSNNIINASYRTNDLSNIKVIYKIPLENKCDYLSIIKDYCKCHPEQISKNIDMVKQLFPDLDLKDLEKQIDLSFN